MRKVLAQRFFARPALTVARNLIGKYLVVARGGKQFAYRITETEAYVGPHDKGSHAHKGRTKRTETMYAKPGTLYVYLIYGMYHMLNVVTDRHEYPAAVLIRGVRGLDGPGKLTKTLRITKALNNKKVGRESGLWFEDRGVIVPRKDILKTPRIGIAYAKEWADKPFRFVLRED